MKDRSITLAIAAVLFAAAGPAMADHNSKNGEGWANMPNDIHNTRVETRETQDNDAFRDFVKFGAGSRSVNRFDTADSSANAAGDLKGNPRNAESRQASSAAKQSERMTRTTARDRARKETHVRTETRSLEMSQLKRNPTSSRGTGSRRGGNRMSAPADRPY